MNPGETFRGFDFQNHLWMVLSSATRDGRVAVANLTTHGRARSCGTGCVIVRPGEHPFVVRDSCVHYQKATMAIEELLDDAKERRTLDLHTPLSAEVLRRVQDGALESRHADRTFRDAVRATLGRSDG